MRLASLSIVLAAAALQACNPGDCQGGGFGDQNTPTVIDKGAPSTLGTPLCVGNNTTVDDDVNISNQAQLNQMAGCKIVNGNVAIQNSTDIVDVSPLASLVSVEQGYLLFFNNSALTTVELPNFEQAAYGIGIIQNPALTAATFPTVKEALGDITVLNNAELSNLAFPALERVKNDGRFAGKADNAGNLIIGRNPKFTGFQTFTKLDEIEGFFSVFANDALVDFTGLEALDKIDNAGKNAQAIAIGIDFDDDNDIIAAGNASLQDLTGLDELDTVTNGDIFIGFNAAMQNLSGMDDLRDFTGNIFICGNDELQDLSGIDGDGNQDGVNDGLQNVTGSIFIGLFFDAFKQPRPAGNKNLQDLTGLNHLGTLTGSLVLAFNDQLQDFNGLDALQVIGGDLVLLGSNFDDFKGADALTTINGNFSIGQVFGNDDQALDTLFSAGADGVFNTADDQAADPRVTVDLDPADDTDGFPALTSVGKDLIVAFSDTGTLDISDAAGGLANVGGRLILHDSDLEDLQGFETVGTLGGLFVGLTLDKNDNISAGGNNNFSSFNGLSTQNGLIGAKGFGVGFNDSLDDLSSLAGLVNNVTGDVTIVGEDFQNLQGFNVGQIGGDLNIGAIKNGNDVPVDAGLDNLDALQLDQLTNVGGDILISFNDNLNDVGFAVLTAIGGKFEVTASAGLDAIDGSDQLNNAGALFFHDLPNTTSVSLPNLVNVNGDLVLTRNPKVATITFTALQSVGNNLELSFNDALEDFDSLANLNTVGNIAQRSGDLILVDNNTVNDIDGFIGLQTVGGDFLLEQNESVDNVALTALTAVGRTFEVANMDGLTDFVDVNGNGMNLGSVGDALRVRDNPNLESLKGLESVTSIGLTLSLVNNPKLETVLIDGNGNDVADEVDDAGLIALVTIGNNNPDLQSEDGNNAQGDRGVIEAQNNPKLDEGQLDDLIQDLDGFQGDQGCDVANNVLCGVLLCGNQSQAFNNFDPTFDAATCDVDVFADVPPPAGEGEGEGEGE